MPLLSQPSRPHVAAQLSACRASRRRLVPAHRQLQPHTVSSPRRALPDDSTPGSADDDAPVVDVSAWRDFRARLVAAEREEDRPVTTSADRWAHSLPAVETGCVLIANPSLFSTTQTYFNKAVIFIYSHSNSGSAGVILNRATDKRFRDVTKSDQFAEFQDSLLWLGGDVGRSTMHVLHPEHIGGTRVVPGVAMGGFDEARRAVRNGTLERDQCKFLTRYSGWGAGQLEDEVAQGVWFVAACSAAVILKGCASPSEMWADVLTLMGGEYARMAATTLAEE